MSANATLVLNAAKARLEELFPDNDVHIFKGNPGPDPGSELAGWRPGIGTDVFTVSCLGPEEVEGLSSFEEIYVKYPVNISYVKASNADPGRWAEDPDIRTIRQTVRGGFYGYNFADLRPMTFDVRYRAGKVYGVTDDKGQVIVSEQWVDFQTYEVRED